MKELLDRFGLTEIIGYFLPGVLALCALLPWGTPDPSRLFGAKLGENEFVLGALTLVVAYALGLVLSIWGRWAQSVTRPQFGGQSFEEIESFAANWLKWQSAFLVARPLQAETIFGLLDITALADAALKKPLKVDSLTLVSLFRSIAAGRIRESGGMFLGEAEVQRRRYLFSTGVSSAMLVLAASSLLRLGMAVLGGIPSWQLDLSASWRWSAIFYVLQALAVAAVIASSRIWLLPPPHRKRARILAATLATAAIACPLWVWWMRDTQPVYAGVVAAGILVVVSVRICGALPPDASLNQVFMGLYILGALAAAVALLAASPLEWVEKAKLWDAQHPTYWLPLALFTVGVILGGRLLRNVAARCFEGELAYTLAMARLYEHYF